MTVARMPIVALLALALAAPAAAKQGHLRLKYPPAGQASLTQLTFKGKPGKPRLKGKLPSDVGVVVGARKVKKGRWTQRIVVFRRRAAARAASTFLVAGPGGLDDQYAKGSLRGAITRASYLGTTLPATLCGGARPKDVFGRGLAAGETPGGDFGALLAAGCGGAGGAQTFLCANGLAGCSAPATNPGGDAAPAFAFTAGPTFTPGAGVADVATGDFNGDGQADIVTSGTDGFTLFAGGPGGTIGSPTTVASPHPLDRVAIGDVNGDGKQDLIGMSSQAGSVQAFLGNGSGAFTPATSFDFSSGAPLHGLAIGNFNGDGRADLAVGQDDGQAAVLIGQPGGGFAGNDFPAGTGGALYALAVADFNADGSPDLVVTGTGGGPHVLLLINQGNGSSFPAGPSTSLLGPPADLAAGDFDGQGGLNDIAIAETGNVQIFPSNGDGTWGTPVNLPFTGGVRVAAGDVNGDGVSDILVLNQGAGSVSTYLGQAGAGLAGYHDPVSSSVGANPVALSLLNFNGDGRADIGVVNSGPRGGIFLGGP